MHLLPDMGKYAFYVWTSYSLTMVVMLVMLLSGYQKHRRNYLRAADVIVEKESKHHDA